MAKVEIAMLFQTKKLEMLSMLLKNVEMKDIKAAVDAYPCDEEMAKNQARLSIREKERLELRLGMTQSQIKLDKTVEVKYFGCMYE